MKILSIGNFGRGWDGSICDEEHIAKALEELGHEVIRIQREEAGQLMVPKEPVDFTLIAQWDGYGNKLVMDLLPSPAVYWAFDYQADGQEWHERLICECDVYLSKPLSDSRKHENWRWLSQDFAPSFLDRLDDPVEKDIEVLFTGSWVPWGSGQKRVEILRAIDQKYDLHIYGVTPEQWRNEGFKNVHGPVMDHELPQLIARAKINFSMDHIWSPGYWSDRNAQIMACGGLVLFRHVPLSEAVFHDHIVYFYDEEDCLERIAQLLERPQEDLDDVAEGGYEHAHKHLMAEDRVSDMLRIVEEFL